MTTNQLVDLPNSLDGDTAIKDYLLLMKPRVMSLVVFTALIGLLAAPSTPHPLIAMVAILCITLGAGSAAAINMWYDRDIDALMQRTCTRPIITKKIAPEDALSFGILLGFFSSFMMALCVNLYAALLLLFTITYYIFVYTIWLKRRNTQNVVIGGLAGALPPVIGWVAATGEISLPPIILATIIFVWTPPHSWALALYRIEDYKNSATPMLPVIKGKYHTKIQILVYSLSLFIISLIPFFIQMAGFIYLATAVSLGVMFIYYAFLLFCDDEGSQAAKRLFIYSIFYLFTIFLAILSPI